MWSAYVTGLYKRQVALQNAGVQEAATGTGAELRWCRKMLARVGSQNDESIVTLLRQARDALVLHRERTRAARAAVRPLGAQRPARIAHREGRPDRRLPRL